MHPQLNPFRLEIRSLLQWVMTRNHATREDMIDFLHGKLGCEGMGSMRADILVDLLIADSAFTPKS